MAVVVKEIDKLRVDKTEYDLAKDIVRVPSGKSVSVHIKFSVGADLFSRDVYVALYDGTKIIGEQKVGEANPFWPWKDIDDWYDYIMPASLSTGAYYIGARTEDESGYNTALMKQIIVTSPLTPGYAQINIDSEPMGAVVYINGERRGTTPLSAQVPPGVYDIKVEKEDYKVKEIRANVGQVMDDTWRVYVKEGEVAGATFVLEPEVSLWRSAWFWGLAGLGVGAVLAVRKKPEYVRRAREAVRPYVERAKEVVKPYAERVVGAVRR